MRLSPAMKAEILQHAKAETPRECCGLIAVVKGRRKYFPCQNIAETPDEHFVLSGWEAVEDQGEVIAIVHRPYWPTSMSRMKAQGITLSTHVVTAGLMCPPLCGPQI